ncbi:hypothetical protein ESB13_15065 [Filimonas effusa]|uniref:DUF6265 domain-containing protein n=2 Tax=Filimonas effusa TaxID=2508721 RepID=A0A4V1M9Z7_9BACT|nr:hypothetical protein ESB13_15065 [Filimonas effusa]
MNVVKYFCFLLPCCLFLMPGGASIFKVGGLPGDGVRISELKWLLGTWQQKKSNGAIYESWQQIDDSTFYGKSYYLKAADTMMLEVVSLEHRNGQLWYVATTMNQNDRKPVAFVMRSGTPSYLVFENPAHDFPTRITYRHLAADSLMAEISGRLDGKAMVRQFPMSRVVR